MTCDQAETTDRPAHSSAGRCTIAAAGVGLLLGCAGFVPSEPGFREIATGPHLEVELTGAMQGRMTLAGVSEIHLDDSVGLYGPRTPFPAPPDGAWMATRTVGDPATAIGGWWLEGKAPPSAPLTWSGGCDVPDEQAWNERTVMVFSGPPSTSVSMLVPLANQGMAKFEGEAKGTVGDEGSLTATGVWSIPWCGTDNTERKAGTGTGTVTVRWAIEPATRRSWEAPARGAF